MSPAERAEAGPTEAVAAAPARKTRVAIARFPGGGAEVSECVDWLVATAYEMAGSDKYELLRPFRISDTPITMSRNRAVQVAQDHAADVLVMVDSDVGPDCDYGKDPEAVKFLDAALEFMGRHDGPCVVAAPYCGPPPHESVYVFDWKWDGDVRRPDFRGCLEMIPRNDAARRRGIMPAAALPTGLMAIDMRVFERLPHPYFYYEAKGHDWTEKASTEDVTFSRDLTFLRIPIYCHWSAWATHSKVVRVGRPLMADVDIVGARLREIVAAGYERGDLIRHVGDPACHWPQFCPQGDVDQMLNARWHPEAHPHPLPVVAGSRYQPLPVAV